MSKYKYWWRPNVDRALREYPALRRRKDELQSAALTPNYNPMPSGNGTSRTTENLAAATLPEQEEKWLTAIERAISTVSLWRDGKLTIQLIRMIYFSRSHTVIGAAEAVHVSESTAKRAIGQFCALVGKNMGFVSS
jgi:hypothetical protein